MYDLDYYRFNDDDYMQKRTFSYDAPMSIYEVHINGFDNDQKELNTYRHLKETLIPYVLKNGFTHIELMPVFEHPFDGSWGYQSTGFFAATSRYGTPYDLMDFINECHLNGIGVILDVVYAHFVQDDYGLVNFDFEPLYEYDEEHLMKSEWGSYYFNLNSKPVISFLMSSANFYLEKYHFDGLRFDAVSHFIYHKGNRDLGDNIEGLSFVKRMNYHLKKLHPSVMLIAEDSTDYPNVTKETNWGGLGFDYKWDLGWMNDTLKYYKMDHEYRKYHHNLINFSMAYFYNEKFILPFSHDEVVHSKGTIVDKMFGTYEEKFRLCRNLFVYMFTHPGKKLNFMGNEFAMFREFDEKKELDWFMLKYPLHDSFLRFFKDLNLIFRPGAMYGVSGKSGSGKTTLLNILGLIDFDYQGTYKFKGKAITGKQKSLIRKLYKQEIYYVFQNYALIDDLSVKENLKLITTINPKYKDRLSYALQMVGLDDSFLKMPIYELSGGEQQRVSLCRAYLRDSSVILADEPTGNLDKDNAVNIINILKRFADDGKIVIVATHDLDILKNCDEIIKLPITTI